MQKNQQMKTYFIYAIKTNNDAFKGVSLIKQYLKKLTIIEVSDFYKDVRSGNLKNQELAEANIKVKKNISASDFCIFELSNQSIGVGGLLYYALNINKSVIGLYQRNKCPQLVDGENNPNFHLLEYSPETINQVLKKAIAQATQEQEVRFNLMLPVSMRNFLQVEAQKKQLSKAALIRNLIKNLEKEPPLKVAH